MPQGSQTVSEDGLGTIIQINDLYFLCGCRKLSMFLQNCSWTNFILHQGFGITTHLFFQFCRMMKFVLKTFSNLFHYCTSVKLQHTRASQSLPLPITLKLSSMQIPHSYFPEISRGSENIESIASCNWPAICLTAWECIQRTLHKTNKRAAILETEMFVLLFIPLLMLLNTFGMHPCITDEQMTTIREHLLSSECMLSFLESRLLYLTEQVQAFFWRQRRGKDNKKPIEFTSNVNICSARRQNKVSVKCW